MAGVASPAEGVQLKAGVTRPCPCPYSLGPLAIFCLLLFALAACPVTGPYCFFPPLPFGARIPRFWWKEGCKWIRRCRAGKKLEWKVGVSWVEGVGFLFGACGRDLKKGVERGDVRLKLTLKKVYIVKFTLWGYSSVNCRQFKI